MDIKVNNIAQVTQVPEQRNRDGTFKFTLAICAITDADLQAKVELIDE